MIDLLESQWWSYTRLLDFQTERMRQAGADAKVRRGLHETQTPSKRA